MFFFSFVSIEMKKKNMYEEKKNMFFSILFVCSTFGIFEIYNTYIFM